MQHRFERLRSEEASVQADRVEEQRSSRHCWRRYGKRTFQLIASSGTSKTNKQFDFQQFQRSRPIPAFPTTFCSKWRKRKCRFAHKSIWKEEPAQPIIKVKQQKWKEVYDDNKQSVEKRKGIKRLFDGKSTFLYYNASKGSARTYYFWIKQDTPERCDTSNSEVEFKGEIVEDLG